MRSSVAKVASPKTMLSDMDGRANRGHRDQFAFQWPLVMEGASAGLRQGTRTLVGRPVSGYNSPK